MEEKIALYILRIITQAQSIGKYLKALLSFPAIFVFLTGSDTVCLIRPSTEVNLAAAVGTERPERTFLCPFNRFATDRAFDSQHHNSNPRSIYRQD